MVFPFVLGFRVCDVEGDLMRYIRWDNTPP